MARGRYRNNDYTLAKIIFFIFVLATFYLVSLFKTNNSLFFVLLWGGAIALVLIVIGIYAWHDFQSKRQKKKISDLLDSVKQAGADENIKNFINSLGYQKKAGKDLWKDGEFSFTWQQLEIFRKALHDKGVKLSMDDYKDISLLLKHYIYNKEDKFVRDSIASIPHTTSQLTGTEFEVLLCKLYEAMGYSAMKTGKTGDQGCDLVVNMGSERVVVQAKCYTGSVGNSAVQEASTALKLYNCTRAMVVTTSYFTPEAIQLAKVNNVELIGGERLRELLVQYLGESWS